jgi:hypothetical protein
MLHTLRENLSLLLILLVTSSCLAPKIAHADDHVVSTSELHGRLAGATQARADNVSKIRNFLSTEPAQGAFHSAGLDADQVKVAVPLLSDEELNRLAAMTDEAQSEIRGGSLSRTELMYIIIALATALIVVAIVKK